LNSPQASTLKAIFTEPVPSGIEWVTIGCEVIEGSGSRVRFVFK